MTYKEARDLFNSQNKKTYTILEIYKEKLDFMYFCKSLLDKEIITESEYLRFTN